jgi:hypothetical protein
VEENAFGELKQFYEKTAGNRISRKIRKIREKGKKFTRQQNVSK